MDILRFLIGLVTGLIIALIIWYLNRQKLAKLGQSEAAARQQLADAQTKLKGADVSLTSERAGHQAAIQQATSQIENARGETEALRARLAASEADCQQQTARLEAQLDSAQSEAEDLRSELAAAHAETQALQERLAALPSEPTRGEFDALAAAVAAEDEGPDDDLTLIEGIGPKISALLKQAGIHSFKQLSQTRIDRLREILDAAGSNFRIANPATWSVQAHLAAAGLLDELKALQDVLTGGVKR